MCVCARVSVCVLWRDRGKMLTRRWPLVGIWRQLILQPMGWLKGDSACVCVCVWGGGGGGGVRTIECTGEAQRQGRSSVGRLRGKPPRAAVRRLTPTIWRTDVFYVEKYTFHSMECLHWQRVVTHIMAAVFHCYCACQYLQSRGAGWPAGRRGKLKTFIWFSGIKSTFLDLVCETMMKHKDTRTEKRRERVRGQNTIHHIQIFDIY